MQQRKLVLYYTYGRNKKAGREGSFKSKNMWKQEWNVKIDEIWYYFSEEVPHKTIKAWRERLHREFTGKVVDLKGVPGIKFPCRERQTIFLVTDTGKYYDEAYYNKLPFLLYLHESNRQECFQKAPYAVTGLEAAGISEIEDVYRRFYKIPWTILETERCVVRELSEDDLEELYVVYADASVTRYTEGLYEDKEKERAYLKEYIRSVYGLCGFGIWAVIWKKTGKLIGRAGLAVREGFETPELGYIISVPYQRMGIAYEVCSAILKYAAEQLCFNAVRVLFETENEPSRRLCQKLGVHPDRHLLMEGKEMEQYIYTGISK